MVVKYEEMRGNVIAQEDERPIDASRPFDTADHKRKLKSQVKYCQQLRA